MNGPSARSKRSRRWIWSEPGIFLSAALSRTKTNYGSVLSLSTQAKKARHPLGVPCSVPTCLVRLLLPCHFETDLRVLFSLHCDLLARFPSFLLPPFCVVGSRWRLGP